MAGFVGRDIDFTWAGSEVPGVREKGISLSGEPIDVSADDSSGWRVLLTVPAEKQVNITIAGVTKSAALRAAWFSGATTANTAITYPSTGGSIAGSFYLASYEETAAYNDAVTFSAELQSTGAVTYTPGS